MNLEESKAAINLFISERNNTELKINCSIFDVIEYCYQVLPNISDIDLVHNGAYDIIFWTFEEFVVKTCSYNNTICLYTKNEKTITQETLINLNTAKTLMDNFILTKKEISFKANFPGCEIVDYLIDRLGFWDNIESNHSGSCYDVWYTFNKFSTKYVAMICFYCNHVKLYIE